MKFLPQEPKFSVRWCTVVTLLLMVASSYSEIVGVGVLPHGDFVYDPGLYVLKKKNTDVTQCALSQWIQRAS